MKLDDTVQVAATVLAAGWVVVVWCVSRLTKAYSLKAQVEVEYARLAAATEKQKYELTAAEAALLRQRMESTHGLVDVWETSLEHMQGKLKDVEARLGERTLECDELRSALVKLQGALDRLPATHDPLAEILAREDRYQALAQGRART